jgi:hypothetical protein
MMDQVNCQRHGASQAHLAQEPSPETVRPSFALGTAVNSVVSRIAHKLFQLKNKIFKYNQITEAL